MERDQDIFKELVILMASHSKAFYNSAQIHKAAGERARNQEIYTHHLDLLCDLELTKERDGSYRLTNKGHDYVRELRNISESKLAAHGSP